MAEVINNIVDGAFALIIVVLFGAFIYARVKKIAMGEVLNRVIGWLNQSPTTQIKQSIQSKQIWQEKRTRI